MNRFLKHFEMAVYYAVEFPWEDAKSKGPYIVPETKVKLADKRTLVQWSVVNENGDVKDAYFEATNLKTGSKKDCGEFIDRLKKSREEVEIRNKIGEGRSRKKPARLDDYEDPENPSSSTGKPPATKRPRKALFQIHLDNVPKSVHSQDEDDIDIAEDLDAEGSAVLAHWEQTVAKRRSNGFSRPKGNGSKETKKVSKPFPKEKRKKATEGNPKTALKKARDETANTQSCEIGKILAVNSSEMKVIRHGFNGGPVEFNMPVSRSSTFGALRTKLSQMTGILPSNQLLIIKGKEWVMEDSKIITEDWSPEDIVAISEKGAKVIGKY